MKLELQIPDYISIANFKKLHTIEHLTGFEKLIETIHMFTDVEKDEIRKWDINSISKIAKDLSKPIDAKEAFYPIIEFKGIEYGYSSIKNMTLGEYVDLERLCKDPKQHLHTIAAILYRPLTENKVNGLKYNIKNGIKVARGKQENLFKYYKIEKYDTFKRDIRADEFENFPVQYISGALGFFLASVTISLKDIRPSSAAAEAKWMKIAAHQSLKHLENIGGGLQHFINSQKPMSLKSQEIKVSLN